MNMKNVSKSKRFLGLLSSCSLFCIQLFELVVFLRIEESILSFFNATFVSLNQFYLPSTKILLLEGVDIDNIDHTTSKFFTTLDDISLS